MCVFKHSNVTFSEHFKMIKWNVPLKCNAWISICAPQTTEKHSDVCRLTSLMSECCTLQMTVDLSLSCFSQRVWTCVTIHPRRPPATAETLHQTSAQNTHLWDHQKEPGAQRLDQHNNLSAIQ